MRAYASSTNVYWDRILDYSEKEMRRVVNASGGISTDVKRDGSHLITRRGLSEYHLWIHQTDYTPGHGVIELSSVSFPHLAGVSWRVGWIGWESMGWPIGSVREDLGDERAQIAQYADDFAKRHGFC
jgi:hypothetical protein